MNKFSISVDGPYIQEVMVQRIARKVYKQVYRSLAGTGIKKKFPFNVAHRMVMQFFMPMDVQGHKMFLDAKDSLGLLGNDGMYEPLETNFIKGTVKKGDVVVDIGGQIGYHTLLFARLVGDDGKVFVFEPDPDNFALLKKNVELNGYKNVVLENKAVSNENGVLKLFLCDYNKGMHRVYKTDFTNKSVDVEAIKLDDYFSDYTGRIDFIKMDIEGAEYSAVQGMGGVLKANPAAKILTEFAPNWIKAFGVEPDQYVNLLKDNGLRIYNLDEEMENAEQIESTEALSESDGAQRNHMNLVCIGSEAVLGNSPAA